MSHQRYPSSSEPAKEPHSVSLKVLRLARPSLVFQHPIPPPDPYPPAAAPRLSDAGPSPASLAYGGPRGNAAAPGHAVSTTNTDPFVLSPILALPASFGSTYVGETFSCTLCANNEVVPPEGEAGGGGGPKRIRDVRIEAEMKTPSAGTAPRIDPPPDDGGAGAGAGATDLEPGQTLQRVVAFHLREKGNHVLAVTVSYYEATDTSGRGRTFRKLYQFACKPALIVRTKVTALSDSAGPGPGDPGHRGRGRGPAQGRGPRRWALEAQLENCSDEALQLDRVFLETERGLRYEDLNWACAAPAPAAVAGRKPRLHPGEVEQVCFVVGEDGGGGGGGEEAAEDNSGDGDGDGSGNDNGNGNGAGGRVMFGIMGVGWRGEMGSVGFLSTGRLGTSAGVAGAVAALGAAAM